MARLIVTGANIVWEGKPGRGGHAMYALQWLEGLRRLGHEVLYVDKAWEPGARHLFGQIIERWWTPNLSALIRPSGESIYGLSATEVERFGNDAAALICLGPLFGAEPPEWLAHVRPRVLIDNDPAFTQLWAAGEEDPARMLGQHDFHFTIGANIGTSRCTIPTLGITWHHVWNPVVLAWWAADRPVRRDRFTTVGGLWGNYYQEFAGQLWGPKAEQLRRFIDLPRLAGESLELALDAEPEDEELTRLREHGWTFESPSIVAADPDAYREYVSQSLGEFSCAKGLYVGSSCGWFSDRSACYLAAGRPVVVQSTGFADVISVGKGLFSVTTVEEAAEAIRQIRRDYALHATTARRLAVEHFNSDRLLEGLCRRVGVPGAA